MLIDHNFLDRSANTWQVCSKFIGANKPNFVTRNLSKTIMKRSKLRNKYLRERTNKESLYNKQRILCESIFRKNKRGYFAKQNCY